MSDHVFEPPDYFLDSLHPRLHLLAWVIEAIRARIHPSLDDTSAYRAGKIGKIIVVTSLTCTSVTAELLGGDLQPEIFRPSRGDSNLVIIRVVVCCVSPAGVASEPAAGNYLFHFQPPEAKSKMTQGCLMFKEEIMCTS